MFKSIVLIFVLGCVQWCAAQDLTVRVDLKDGGVAEGKLLKISAEGVELNPGGLVKMRFIPAERIVKAEILETHKTVFYPIGDQGIPSELLDIEPSSTAAPSGKARFVMTGSFGYAMAQGTYYKGFNGGTVFRLGADVYFRRFDPAAGRFMLGFSFSHYTIGGDQILGLDPALSVNAYCLEFGRSTAMFDGGHYLYFKVGVGAVTNEVTMTVQRIDISYSETKPIFRFEGAGSILLAPSLSLVLMVDGDILLAKASSSNIYQTQYNYGPLTGIDIAGGMIHFGLGVSYAL
jgi:hypothetical protein